MKVPNITSMLLTALLALGGFTVNLVHEDANRMIKSIDEMGKNQAADHAAISINSTNISNLKDSDSRQWAEISKKADRE